jgi:hypothetical protein
MEDLMPESHNGIVQRHPDETAEDAVRRRRSEILAADPGAELPRGFLVVTEPIAEDEWVRRHGGQR